MRVVAWAVVLVSACGRFGFDSHSASGDAGDARAGDAPHTDVPADVGDPDAPACPYELCDNFEADNFSAVWTPRPGASVDFGTAHGGAHSAHFQLGALTAGQMSYVQIGQSSTLPLGDTTFYVRAWVRMGSLPAAGNGMELITAEQTGGANEDAVFVHTTTLDLYEQWTDGGQATLAPAPTNTWFCVLWTVTRDTGANGSQALGGDVGPITLTNVPTDGTPAIDRMGFGIGFASPNVSNPQPAMEMWIDDIIISSTPVTCAG
jgi:hypothetical protein